LTRVTERRGEFALRASLGASRLSIVRQQLAETTVICMCGAAVGMMLMYWAMPAILSVYPAALPSDTVVGVDFRVSMLMLAVVVVAALIAGTVPALRAGASEVTSVLAESSLRQIGSPRETRWRQLLVAAQVALSLVLLGTAALIATSIQRLNHTDPGFDAT